MLDLILVGFVVGGALCLFMIGGQNEVVESDDTTKELGEETYKYFLGLCYEDQEYYFKNNEYLKQYIDREYYPNDKSFTARGAARIARLYNREFTNKYDRY